MSGEGTVPVDHEVVEEGGFLTELGADYAGDFAETFYFLGGRTVLGEVVLLVGAVEHVAEAVGDEEVLVDLILGSDVDVELRLLLVVFVITLSVGQYPIRIDQAVVTITSSKEEGVVGIAIILTCIHLCGGMETQHACIILDEICVRANERRLNETKHVG